jgi:hypothetical protein
LNHKGHKGHKEEKTENKEIQEVGAASPLHSLRFSFLFLFVSFVVQFLGEAHADR